MTHLLNDLASLGGMSHPLLPLSPGVKHIYLIQPHPNFVQQLWFYPTTEPKEFSVQCIKGETREESPCLPRQTDSGWWKWKLGFPLLLKAAFANRERERETRLSMSSQDKTKNGFNWKKTGWDSAQAKFLADTLVTCSIVHAKPGRAAKQEEEQISYVHVPTIFHFSVYIRLNSHL